MAKQPKPVSPDLEWIRESNLIEGIDDPKEDKRSLKVWQELQYRSTTEETIKWIHKRIMYVLEPQMAGKLRKCAVMVGGMVCPHWPTLPKLLTRWTLDCRDIKTADDVKRAHIQFERIHPFEDGNGRTGRMLMNLQRKKLGLEPLCIKASERVEYYQWFKGVL